MKDAFSILFLIFLLLFHVSGLDADLSVEAMIVSVNFTNSMDIGYWIVNDCVKC